MVTVQLHVYDLSKTENENINGVVRGLNSFTREISFGGIFHGGIEVYGQEWSFGYCQSGTGVYRVAPTTNSMYQFRETIQLGTTTLSASQVALPSDDSNFETLFERELPSGARGRGPIHLARHARR